MSATAATTTQILNRSSTTGAARWCLGLIPRIPSISAA